MSKKSLIKAIFKNIALINLKEIKSISFLCHSEHGFKQAPYEAITETAYNELVNSVQAIDIDNIGTARDIDVADCEGGVCPVNLPY